MCVSMPPAVRILPSPAMISVAAPIGTVTPGCTAGLPAFPIPHAFPLKAEHPPQAAVGHQAHRSRLPRFEPHRRAGRNIEPEPQTLRAVEPKARIGLEEMIVGS